MEKLLQKENPTVSVNLLDSKSKSCLFINGRAVVNNDLVKIINSSDNNTLFLSKNEVVAAKVSGSKLELLKSGLPELFSISDFQNLDVKNIEAKITKYPWELVNRNGKEISNDFELLVNRNSEMILGEVYSNVTLVKKENIFIGEGTKIKPGVVLDAEDGPIYIGSNSTVMANAVIEGPCFIGDNSTIKIAAKIYENTSIGEVCKVGGVIKISQLVKNRHYPY